MRAVYEALAGRKLPGVPPLDWSEATEFQRLVWTALRQIAPSETRSYAEIATAIGRPKAARAVGAACGANPVPLLVPCHRVLASGGGLGGFSAGLRWKKLLLAREGITLR
jgi:O-6-methylguanine DNA methyltransferase